MGGSGPNQSGGISRVCRSGALGLRPRRTGPHRFKGEDIPDIADLVASHGAVSVMVVAGEVDGIRDEIADTLSGMDVKIIVGRETKGSCLITVRLMKSEE